jgi:hypothetical protein
MKARESVHADQASAKLTTAALRACQVSSRDGSSVMGENIASELLAPSNARVGVSEFSSSANQVDHYRPLRWRLRRRT